MPLKKRAVKPRPAGRTRASASTRGATLAAQAANDVDGMDIDDVNADSVTVTKGSPIDATGDINGPEGDVDSEGEGEAEGSRKRTIDRSSRPLVTPLEIFEDMYERHDTNDLDLRPVKINVATVCSGTDAPIFGLTKLGEASEIHSGQRTIEYEHLFSCEIEPFKQAFLRRNLPPDTVIFRDVVEMAKSLNGCA